MHNIPNDPLYWIFDHEEQLDVRLVPVEEAEEGEVVRPVDQSRGLGDDQLVGVGQWHLVLQRSVKRQIKITISDHIVLYSFDVNPISTIVLVFLGILSGECSCECDHLYGVSRSGDLRMYPELLYDGPGAALLDPNHQDIREP